jgi:hypothetical protein
LLIDWKRMKVIGDLLRKKSTAEIHLAALPFRTVMNLRHAKALTLAGGLGELGIFYSTGLGVASG